jgi:hypothetical protein
MRKFDIIVCSVLEMKCCGNATVSFTMSVCLVPVKLICYMELCVLASALCVHACCLIMLLIAKVNNK